MLCGVATCHVQFSGKMRATEVWALQFTPWVCKSLRIVFCLHNLVWDHVAANCQPQNQQYQHLNHVVGQHACKPHATVCVGGHGFLFGALRARLRWQPCFSSWGIERNTTWTEHMKLWKALTVLHWKAVILLIVGARFPLTDHDSAAGISLQSLKLDIFPFGFGNHVHNSCSFFNWESCSRQFCPHISTQSGWPFMEAKKRCAAMVKNSPPEISTVCNLHE